MQILKPYKALLLLLVSQLATGCFRALDTQTQQAAKLQGQPTIVVRSDSNASQDSQASDTAPNAVGNAGSEKPLLTVAAGQDNSNLLLGNPSDAGRDKDNYLVERPQHSLSYNKANGGPNWVSWHLDKSNIGRVKRGDFWPDPLLPADMQIRPTDYRGSGYDRGHVCPSADRTSNREDNDATFVMSNMLPQAPSLNQQVWKDLEDYSRYLLSTGNELYIVAGGIGSAGRIASGKVNVPDRCWKIIVALSVGNSDLQRIDANTRVIAVSMPNRDGQDVANSKWAQWIVSIAELEKATGYDFLPALPDDVERALEQKVDSGRARRGARENTSGQTPDVVATEPSGAPAPAANSETVTRQSPEAASQGATQGQVWVNTRSGIYHYPGARWYGNTKQGEYMSESQAIAQGHRAARNGQ